MKRFKLPDGSVREAKLVPGDSAKYSAQALQGDSRRVFLENALGRRRYWIQAEKDRRILSWHGGCLELTEEEFTAISGGIAKELQPLRLTMPGKVVDIKVQAGDIVEKGQCLLVVEAMKMENNLLALGRAKVKQVNAKKDDRLDAGVVLITFEAP